jgi:hypothetical protein
VNDTGNPGTVNGGNGEAVLSYQQPATSPPPGTGQASTQLAALHQAVHGVGVKNTLAVTVASAQRQLAAGHTRLACRTLTTFITQVRHQTPRFIPASTATHLITDAKTIRALLAC